MRLSKVFVVVDELRFAMKLMIVPTIKALFNDPFLIFSPRRLSQIAFYNFWITYGAMMDEGSRTTKEMLIPPNAKGIVLDIGAGLGSTTGYLNRDKVTRYIALEPNILMHLHIRDKAQKAGFSEQDGSLLILPYGAEDYKSIASALGGFQTVDTIISVLTLCSVPRPEQTVRNLVDNLLKPGGELLFYEHVASKRQDVLFWQRFWTPIWKTFLDGCSLIIPSDVYIRNIPCWEPVPDGGRDAEGRQVGAWNKPGEEEEHMWWHQVGRFIKRLD